MKRIIALVCVIVLAVSVLTACGNKVVNIPTPVASDDSAASSAVASSAAASSAASSDAASSQAVQVDPNSVVGEGKTAEGIKVEGLSAFTEYSNQLFLILTNESGTDCNVTVNVDFFDKNGNIVGTTSGYVDAFVDGTSVAESFYCDDPFAKYEYNVASSDIDYYLPVDKDLKVEVNKATNKIIISITNNGKVAAKYPEYTALFFKDGKLVYDNWGFCDDADSEIKPGATERDECSCYEEFDDVKVYVHSYAYKD